MEQAKRLLDEWFSQEMQRHWFNSTVEIDQALKQKYEPLLLKAKQGKLRHWLESAETALALVILLDQIPLNIYRGKRAAFENEALAIEAAKQAITRGYEKRLNKQQLSFIYMPLMHSESLEDQYESVKRFESLGSEASLRFARHHCDLIKRFGRFPHRNRILGRESTELELEYLASKEAFTG